MIVEVADDGQVLQGGNEKNFCRLRSNKNFRLRDARTCFFLYSNIFKSMVNGDDDVEKH